MHSWSVVLFQQTLCHGSPMPVGGERRCPQPQAQQAARWGVRRGGQDACGWLLRRKRENVVHVSSFRQYTGEARLIPVTAARPC
jgi:hypothetical protein